MKEHGLLFKTPMVRALLAGTKTQTRRLVKPQPHPAHRLQPAWGTSPDGFAFGEPGLWREAGPDYPDGPEDERRPPHGPVGRILWVRETWAVPPGSTEAKDVAYRADLEDAHARSLKWTPSLLMPRWASRITLEVTRVRLERVQDITEEDARAEGAPSWADIRGRFHESQTMTTGERMLDQPHRAGFAVLWDDINGDVATWKSNPWVFAYDFRRIL